MRWNVIVRSSSGVHGYPFAAMARREGDASRYQHVALGQTESEALSVLPIDTVWPHEW